MWQRLGVVASLLWIVGSGIWQRNNDAKLADYMAFRAYQECMGFDPQGRGVTWPRPTGEQTAKCGTETQAAYDSVMKGSWGNVAGLALFPALYGWILAYVALWVAKWVLAGRKSSN
jgi:hypothetical protein